MIYQPNKLRTSKDMLRIYAVACRNYYSPLAKFREKNKLENYEKEMNDWGIWLEVMSELLGRVVNPSKFLNLCLRGDPKFHFPLPSELLDDKYFEIYESWLKGEVSAGLSSEIIYPFQYAIERFPIRMSC